MSITPQKTSKMFFYAFVCLFFMNFSGFAQQTAIVVKQSNATKDMPYYVGSFAKLQEDAKKADKPYFVYVYNKRTKFDSVTFANQYVQTYIGKRYMPMKLEAPSLYSNLVTEKYDVNTFPQILIFTPQGKLVDRITSYLSPKQMIARLKASENKKGSPEDTKTVFAKAADPALSLKLQTEGEIKEIYQFSVRPYGVEEKTIGIQLGVFQDYQNLVRNVAELEVHWHDNILVTFVEVEGKMMYRLLLGPFYSIEHAESYKKSLMDKMGLAGILVSLETFDPITDQNKDQFSIANIEKPVESKDPNLR